MQALYQLESALPYRQIQVTDQGLAWPVRIVQGLPESIGQEAVWPGLPAGQRVQINRKLPGPGRDGVSLLKL